VVAFLEISPVPPAGNAKQGIHFPVFEKARNVRDVCRNNLGNFERRAKIKTYYGQFKTETHMKTIGVILLAASMIFSPGLLHAQNALQTSLVGSFNNDLAPVQSPAPDSIVQVTAEARSLATISYDNLPRSGTFWEVMPNGIMAPLPCPPQDITLPIYTIKNDIFLVDATGGEVAAQPHRFGMQAQTTASSVNAALDSLATSVVNLIDMVMNPPVQETATPMMRTSMMMASSLSASAAYNNGNPVYLANMTRSYDSYDNFIFGFTVLGGTNFTPWDIEMSTNLTAPNWTWQGIAYTSNSYSFYGEPSGVAFYRLVNLTKTMTVGIGNDVVGQCDVPYGLTNAVQVAGGGGQSIALKADGTVVAWGANYYGEGSVPTNLSGVLMVSAGWYHNVALLTNGMVTAWGFNSPLLGYPLTNVPVNLTNAVVISAQALHTLALRSDGTIVAWGYNTSFGETNVPAGLTNVTAISAGYQFNLVVSNGYVVAWGDNTAGQCTVPAGLSNVVDVAAGTFHSLALLQNGTVAAWGDDFYGESTVPPGLTNVVAIAAGGDPEADAAYSMALKNDGTVVIWGDDDAVDPVGGLNAVVGIAAGADHALAIRTGPPMPVITLEPTDEFQVQGSNATFTARGAGLYGVTYQWQTNGVNLPGATSATLTLTSVQSPAQLFAYSVVVGNEAGSILSSNAYLYFVTPPVIISQSPLSTNQIVMYQTNVVLSVVASAPGMSAGFPISYQWQFNGVNISGATGSSYTFRATAGVSGAYSVLVSNVEGSTNAGWQVTVLGTNGLQIVQQPANQYQIAGGSVTFVSSAVSSNAVTYQWQFNGTNISGANYATLVLTNVQATNQGLYDVIISDSVHTLVSSNASFVLVTPPSIVSQMPMPTNQVFLANSSATLRIVASAPGQTNGFPLHYQWQFNGSNILYQTSTNYTFTVVNSGLYSVIVTNKAGATNASWSVTVLNPGNVWAWGENGDGESSAPQGITNIMAIAAGEYHSVAVVDNGNVIQWGYNWGSVPSNLTNAVSVAAGYSDSIALRSDGTVATWGASGSYANYVPSGLNGVKAVAAGWDDNVALLTNGTVTAWGLNGSYFGWGNMTEIPASLTNATAISAQALHALALKADGTVVAWGDDSEGESDVPFGLSNVVAVAAGGQHSLALKSDGTVSAWGFNNDGQCSVPVGLCNVMAIAAGWQHSVALKNDGAVVSWGDNSDGQTDTPGLTTTKLIAAGGNHTIANIFSSQVMYPVDVTKDVLLIYNSSSTNSTALKDYYLAIRPMISGANVLGVACDTNEITTLTNCDAQIIAPVLNWFTNNPAKRPQYLVLFFDMPTRIQPAWLANGSVSFHLQNAIPFWKPFVTYINGGTLADCEAYIDKLAYFSTNYSPGQLIISANASGYGNTNFILDDIRNGGPSPQYENYSGGGNTVASATNGLLANGVCPSAIYFYDGLVISNNISAAPSHATRLANVAGYISWGVHGALSGNYPVNGEIVWTGNSRWWLIETVESFNGQRFTGQGNFVEWFSSNAFGGTNYSNTPVGAVSHVEEPSLGGVEDSSTYFGLWGGGKNFAICAWNSRLTPYFQAVGDPFVKH
jgi:alpha-tubulin suppressor-like RCC1 family protein